MNGSHRAEVYRSQHAQQLQQQHQLQLANQQANEQAQQLQQQLQQQQQELKSLKIKVPSREVGVNTDKHPETERPVSPPIGLQRLQRVRTRDQGHN